MRVARIARTGAIYDDTPASQTFSAGEMADFPERGISPKLAKRDLQKEGGGGSGGLPGFRGILQDEQFDVGGVNL